MAWLPVKNRVFGWFWFRPCGRSLVRLGLFWGAEEARTRREVKTVMEMICILSIFTSAVRQGWSLYGWLVTLHHSLCFPSRPCLLCPPEQTQPDQGPTAGAKPEPAKHPVLHGQPGH